MNDETLLSMAGAEHQPQQQQQQQQQRKQAWGGRGEAWGSPVKREAGQEKLLAAAYGGFQRAWSESVRELDESYAREVGMGDDDLWRDCTRLREENQALRLENSRLRCTPTQAAQQQPVHNNANNNNNNQHQHQHQNQHHHQHQGHAMNGVSQTQTAVLLSPLLECALSPVSSPIRVFSTNPSSPMFPQVQILSPHAMSDGVLLSNSSMQASHGAPGAGMTVEEKMEAQIDKAKLKTKLCKYYTNGSQKACPFYGRHGWCAFAHGEEELSPVSLPAASPALPTSPLLLGSEGCFPN
ncbi:hypothetical protein DIPPA_19420 [Diplonema papillatum]|nr:hypothetical protein DIPPA_19420 [Diplonema papillatum]